MLSRQSEEEQVPEKEYQNKRNWNLSLKELENSISFKK
jgi:hypothetical protein